MKVLIKKINVTIMKMWGQKMFSITQNQNSLRKRLVEITHNLQLIANKDANNINERLE